MKQLTFLFLTLILFSKTTYAQYQELENNENFKKYKSLKIINYYDKNWKSGWTKKIRLNDGRIESISNYLRSRLTVKVIHKYDEKGNLMYEIKDQETLKYSYIYNDKNQIIEMNNFCKEVYSNFNHQNLPQTIERSCEGGVDSLFGYRYELKYDDKANVIEHKTFSKFEGVFRVETISYKYDTHNNIIELKRSNIPEEKYPRIMIGGRAHHEVEKFRYVFNENNLWTEKYWIVEEKEWLVAKRKFKKK
ncbi:hypothetical protein [Flavobacterium sp.]|uniref:hypothetical protein n=1 Tax=Flavobacterium sp. TaxID=239 RepID=UPI004047F532